MVFGKKIWKFLDSAGANLRIHGALVEMISLRSFQKILWYRFMAGFCFIPHHRVPDTLIGFTGAEKEGEKGKNAGKRNRRGCF